MAQAHRNRVFHDFRAGLCRNLVSRNANMFIYTCLYIHVYIYIPYLRARAHTHASIIIIILYVPLSSLNHIVKAKA